MTTPAQSPTQQGNQKPSPLFFLSVLVFPIVDTLVLLFGKLPFFFPNPVAPVAPHPDARDVRAMNVLITGANSGIGLAMTKDLFLRGATVTMACRSSTKAEKARQEILSQIQSESTKDADSRLLVASLDTSSFANIREFVKNYVTTLDGRKVDLVYLNAGIGGPSTTDNLLTEDGFEMTYQVNFLGHFLLLYLLRSHLTDEARIISTSSAAILLGSSFNDFTTSQVKGRLDPGFHFKAAPSSSSKDPDAYHDATVYGTTKTMQLVMSRAINLKAAQNGSKRIGLAFHPGLVSTSFFDNSADMRSFTIAQFAGKIEGVFGARPENSAKQPVFLGLVKERGLGKREGWSKIWMRGVPFTSVVDTFDTEKFWQRWCADAEIPADWSI
ncbi:hypothetical protein A4X13_0g3358 [Tilletia indica]|uniref:Uncharacterized protein n=1 Tax=Tilletia indica TaxID=43049 RepID=A0A177TDS5_9BASI|nr:hypothetical protein A4X13_0g3358 [Tilletia indica]